MKLLTIILIIIIILAGIYFCSSQNIFSKFDNVGYLTNQQSRYFNNAIYSMPGTVGDPYMLYGAGYMPYEGNVPAVDVMRANNQRVLPAYYKQYLQKNITPYSEVGL
jgi:hypothetical protein